MQAHDAVHLGGEAFVVGGDQRGGAFVADEAEELGEDAVGGVLVEVAGGLVRQHQRGAVGERAGDGDALLLAAGQLRRAVLEAVADAERGQELRRALLGGGAFGAVDELRQDDVLGRVEIGQQMVELVDEAEPVAADRGAPGGVELRRFLAGDADRALEPALEQADRLEQGRLARARGAEQRDDLARRDREVDAAQDVDRLPALGEGAREGGGL